MGHGRASVFQAVAAAAAAAQQGRAGVQRALITSETTPFSFTVQLMLRWPAPMLSVTT